MDLRNEIVVDVDSVSKKDIHIIKSKDVEQTINNENLINEEAQLNEQYNLNKELNNLVNLRYDQVVNSLRKLCTEESKNYMRDVSLNASKMYNNQSSNNVNTQNNNELKTDKGIKETNEEGEEKERENEEEQQQQIEERGEKEENKENEDLKGTTSRKESSKPISLHKKLTYEDGEEEKVENNNENIGGNEANENNNQEMQIDDKTENNKNENNINPNDENNVNNNAGINYNNSTTVNINMSGIGSMSVLEQDEEARLIKSYKEYLAQAEKTIDALFLMKTKNDFLQMVRDKASEFDEANKTLKIIKKVQDINKKGRGSLSKSMGIKEDQNSELEYIVDDNESSKEKELQEKIFRTYMNAERKKMERFINNEREGKPNKK